MIEKIWPINKLYKLRKDVTELKRELLIHNQKEIELHQEMTKLQQKLALQFGQVTAIAHEIPELCQKVERINCEIKQLHQMQNTMEQKFLSEIFDHKSYILQELESYKKVNHEETWMTKFGYDNMISSLQLAAVERVVPGNYNRIKALKNSQERKRCFVIGNGPSLNAEDLDKLKKSGDFCFASKRINMIFDQTEWRPDIWAASDLDYIEMYQEEIRKLKGFPKLLCAQTIVKNNIVIEDAIYYPFIQVERTPQWFNDDILRGVHFYGTITCKLINFAVYMGFKEIYLLGVDNTIPIKINSAGKREHDPEANNHFSPNYFTKENMDNINSHINNIDEVVEYVNSAYRSVKWFCDQLEVDIYNATRGGKLEVYPRVDIDTLFPVK